MVGGHTPLILQTGWDTSYAGWPYKVGECSGVASSDTAAYSDEAQAVAACMALPYSDCAMIFMQIQIGVGGTTQIHRYLRGPSTTYVNNVACATLLNGYSYFRPPMDSSMAYAYTFTGDTSNAHLGGIETATTTDGKSYGVELDKTHTFLQDGSHRGYGCESPPPLPPPSLPPARMRRSMWREVCSSRSRASLSTSGCLSSS